MPDYFGNPYAYDADLPGRRLRALRAAHAVTDEVLEGTSVDLLTSAIVLDHLAADVQPRYDELYITTSEPSLIAGRDVSPSAQPLSMAFVLPADGAASFAMSYIGGSAQSAGERYEFNLDFMIQPGGERDEEQLQAALQDAKARWIAYVAEKVAEANAALKEDREAVERDVRAIIEERWWRRRAVAGAARQLNIPLGRPTRPGPTVPLIPAALTLPAVEAAAAAGGSDKGLAADIANSLISTIEAFSLALERSPVTANKIAEQDEEAIRDVLLFILNSNWQGQATGETFLGLGKADIVLRWHNRDAFIGECKFWKGEKAFVDGIDQLLDRYTVWRATRVALVLFVRDVADVTAVLAKAHLAIEQHDRHIGPAMASGDARSYAMTAQTDRAQIVTLTLVPVVMPNR